MTYGLWRLDTAVRTYLAVLCFPSVSFDSMGLIFVENANFKAEKPTDTKRVSYTLSRATKLEITNSIM